MENTENKIEMNALRGSSAEMVGVQNNYNGLTPQAATKMAFDMFRQYYPELKKELLEQLTTDLMEKLESVPPEKIQGPSPRIAIPTLQNASITPEEEIRRLYAQLLANAMNKDMASEVHPAFVEIINQLCPIEAKILQHFYYNNVVPAIDIVYRNVNSHGEIAQYTNFSDVGGIVGYDEAYTISSHFDNLIRLGLIEKSHLESLANKELYKPLKEHPFVKQYPEETNAGGEKYTRTIKEGYMKVTSFGKRFGEACRPQLHIVVNAEIPAKRVDVLEV